MRTTRSIIESLEPRRLLSAAIFKDLANPGANSNPTAGAAVDGILYFVANTYQVWRTDGTDAGTSLLADLTATAQPITELKGFNHKIYFLSNYQLYSSDGTPANTSVLKDFDPGVTLSSSLTYKPAYLTPSGPYLYFTAAQGLSTSLDQNNNSVTANVNVELWRTDGTPAGTLQTKDIYPGLDHGSYPTALADINGTLYFSATDPSIENNAPDKVVWRSAGTDPTTTRVTDRTAPGTFINHPTNFTLANGVIYFTALTSNSTSSNGLYRTDGTTAGTSYLGAAGSFPAQLTPFGNKLGFVANGLWVSNGTPAGTHLLPTPSSVNHLISFNNSLYFSATSTASGAGNELWRSDGTDPGTTLAFDLNPGLPASNPNPIAVVGNTLYFSATTPAAGAELWSTDGSTASLVKDINPGPAGAAPGTPLGVIGSTLLFAASDDTHGNEPWRTDGTAATTSLVKDVAPGFSPNVSSLPASPTVLNGHLIFTAATSSYGTELFTSDGTPDGTQLLADLSPGTASTTFANFTPLGSYLFFTANVAQYGNELWRTDGTAAGTTLVADLNPTGSSNPTNLTPFNGSLYFFANDGSAYGLYRTDGTPANTTRLQTFNVGTGSSLPANLVAAPASLYFTAYTPTTGIELWRSDGATASLAADIFPGTTGSSPTSLIPFNGSLYFAATGSAAAGNELWRFDGTTPSLVADLNPGSPSSSPSKFLAIGPALYFVATTAATGTELWRTDGTAPSLVTDINPGSASSSPTSLTNLNGSLIFSALDSTAGIELWTVPAANPSAATRIIDLNPGTPSTNPQFIAAIDGLLYFTASLPGPQLYVTDGTAAGTQIVSGLPNGSFASFGVNLLAKFDNRIFAAGFISPYGVELDTLSLPSLDLPPLLTTAPGALLAAPADFRDPLPGPHAATVDYGDGTGSQPLPLNPDHSFSYNHTYNSPGSYTITVTLTSGGDPLTATTALTVQNIPGISPSAGASFWLTPGPSLTLAAGTLTLSADLTLSSLSISPGATLDLAGHSLLLNYATVSPADAVRQLLLSARLTSSSTPSGSRLAYIEAANLPALPPGADLTTLLITPALTGDANVDGRIDADDVALLDRGAAKHLSVWTAGDFNYDGQVDAADRQLFDQSFAAAHPAPAPAPLAPPLAASPTLAAPTVAPTPPSQPARPKPPQSARRNTPVKISLSAPSNLPKSTRLRYAIDFNGDGITDQILVSATPPILRHVYHTKGRFNLTVKISTIAGRHLATRITPLKIT